MSGASLLVALLSFATMVGCNVWLKSMLRLFAPLLGLCVGMAAGFLLDLVPAQELQQWREMPLLRLPQLPVFGWAFEPLGGAALCGHRLCSVADVDGHANHCPARL